MRESLWNYIWLLRAGPAVGYDFRVSLVYIIFQQQYHERLLLMRRGLLVLAIGVAVTMMVQIQSSGGREQVITPFPVLQIT